MKKRLIVIMLLAVMLVLPAVEAFAGEAIRYIVSPNGTSVNLRHGPSEAGYAVACQVKPGTEVKLLARKKNGWSKIVFRGSTVYVKSKYLSATKPGPDGKVTKKPYATFPGRIYSANGRSVNMRVSPDLKSDVIFQLPIWTNVTVIGESGRWYKIEYGIAKGYVLKKYIR